MKVKETGGYICSFCERHYDNAVDRAKCELACAERQQQIKEREEKMKLAKEQSACLEEIRQKRSELDELYQQYEKKYGAADTSFRYLFPSMWFGW